MSEKVLPVHEFGGAAMVSLSAAEDVGEFAHKMIEREAAEELKRLQWIKDLLVVEEPHVINSPSVDYLQRFQAIGWRFKVASEGYGELKKHFACRKRHIPERVTLEFIDQMIREYARQVKEEDYEDDDY